MTCEIDDATSIGDEDHGGCSQTGIPPTVGAKHFPCAEVFASSSIRIHDKELPDGEPI